MSDASMSKAEHRSIFGSDIAAVNVAMECAKRMMARGGGDDPYAVQCGQMLMIFIEAYEAAHDMVHARTDKDSRRAYLELRQLVKQIDTAAKSLNPLGFK
jgi:hypothetical protein